MSFNFNGATVQGDVGISTISPIPTFPGIPTTFTQINASGNTTQTVPAGKKWILVSCGSTYNGAAGFITVHNLTGEFQWLTNATASGNGDEWNGVIVLDAGFDVIIARNGFFTYYEVDV